MYMLYIYIVLFYNVNINLVQLNQSKLEYPYVSVIPEYATRHTI